MAIWFFAYLCNSFAFCLFLLYLKEQDIGTSKENSFTSEIVFYDSGLMLGLLRPAKIFSIYVNYKSRLKFLSEIKRPLGVSKVKDN